MLSELTAVSPIDGRYHGKTKCLSDYFSESALMRYRVRVEVEYFIALCEMGLPELEGFPREDFGKLRSIYLDMSESDFEHIKEIESRTNHDVKAIEYFIKEKMVDYPVRYTDFVHFALTSQDINNTAFPMMLRDGMLEVYCPLLDEVISYLEDLQKEYSSISLLAHTHGQPASPTTLGNEFRVFVYRLKQQNIELKQCMSEISGKFGGATGNLNAHHVTYPSIDWRGFADRFLYEHLNIKREAYTTQISNYDKLSSLFDALRRVHTILMDMDRDIWTYISMGYFKQRIVKGEVGSSAMPHKVNPIDFENSEGNLGMANALLTFLSMKLPISRLQRDLTDSTVLRNVGVPIGHAVVALQSTLKGLGKLMVNEVRIYEDLEDNWAVVAEAIQNILRREGIENPYEMLKDLTRTNQKITAETMADFVENLKVSDAVKHELKAITPHNYIGI